MIKKIAHFADIHIPKSPTRHDEIRAVFERTYKSLKKEKPHRIVIAGDLFHDYIDLQPEATILASNFLNSLAEIAPVRITRGNHDIRKKSLKRKDSIEAVVAAINNPNIIYYNETGFFDDDNVTWAVWKHGEVKNNPWGKRKKPKEGNTVIDLFHDPINGCVTPTGFEMNRKTYKSIEHFKGDYSFFGDIHKLQYFSDKTKAYCGSLFAQNFSEGDYEFHGYLLWDIEKGSVKEVSIKNHYTFKTVNVNAFTDFDELSTDIDSPSKYPKIRVIWKTLPETFNDNNKRKVVSYLKDNYKPISISHKPDFIEDDEIIIENDIKLSDILEQSVQHDIFLTYLEKIGVEDDIADEIIKLDDEITSRIEVEELTNIQWSIIKFSGKNFMSYKDVDIDWRDMNGLFQITGLNAVGKTTIMKLITYILYNKTKETESKVKFGDSRYVNNRSGVDKCEGSIVVDVNGEYFGIRRKTEIERTKAGDMKGAPTTLEYFKLKTPDDELSDENSFENLIDDERKQTQKTLERAIGSYDNFMRVVMTTSDTLNEILSNVKADFTDSLLHDSGLDIFDHKLNAFKEYNKEILSIPRVSCNIEKSEEYIKKLESEIHIINNKVDEIEKVLIPEIDEKLIVGQNYVESLIKKLYNVDSEIYNLDVNNTKININTFEGQISVLKETEERLNLSISELKDSYDEEKLTNLLSAKDAHKDNEYAIRTAIKDEEAIIRDLEYKIGTLKGDNVRLMDQGGKLKKQIEELKSNTNCPTCGQLLDDNHQEHMKTQIKEIEVEMFAIANKINTNNKNTVLHQHEIEKHNIKISELNGDIKKMSFEMEKILNEIGIITNDKNEVERRRMLMVDLEKIPIQMENFQLQMENLKQKINLYNQSLVQIEENKKINVGIEAAKAKISKLETEKNELKDDVYVYNTTRGGSVSEIRNTNDLIIKFKNQERQDVILNTYKKCIHRDGIPTQLLKTYAIPMINKELTNLLENVDFNVWLDDADLKLKLAYNNRLDAVINAISASGKERTFSSVALKFALNQINMKSKPTLFLLDEVMGKLTYDSVTEFVTMLQTIREHMNKVLIVEHNHEILPDYVIDVTKDDNDISTLTIE